MRVPQNFDALKIPSGYREMRDETVNTSATLRAHISPNVGWFEDIQSFRYSEGWFYDFY